MIAPVKVTVQRLHTYIWIDFIDENDNSVTVGFRDKKTLGNKLMFALVKFACEKSGKTDSKEK